MHAWIYLSISKLREMVKDREARSAAVHGITESQKGLEPLSNNNNVSIERNL